ncbi:thiamine biosynthesis lipoprotein [Megasphaera paucivorans]|uniref:FAD:protein FMN transferase n=2 Tax=Megasphaera paucivorans TaxID=349095 RepID=A0A1G9WMZ9_9FIRM|nr:thiamine biosynthesis lipoprotein [Megasphaera paucivorans]
MNRKRYIRLICLAVSIVMINCSGCSLRPEQSYDRSGIAMDTTISLKATGKEAKQAVDEGFAKIAELDSLASTTNPNSDVSRINEAAGKEYVQVDPAIYEMIAYSQQYSAKSQGEWDISIGPITTLWGIGTDQQHVPSDSEIAAALSKVNYKNIRLRSSDHSVMLAQPGMSIDLGGIAKGYAVDEVRKIYEAHHIEKGLINMGASSMYAVGTNKKGKPWNIGIKHPRSEKEGEYLGIVSIKNQALSTSGDYERFFIENGNRYFHIFDPRTGRPADSGIMSDTIIIDGSVEHAGMLSDLLTTAVFVLGPEKGRDLINDMDGVECEVTGTNGTVYVTDGFKKQFSDLNPDFHISN